MLGVECQEAPDLSTDRPPEERRGSDSRGLEGLWELGWAGPSAAGPSTVRKDEQPVSPLQLAEELSQVSSTNQSQPLR